LPDIRPAPSRQKGVIENWFFQKEITHLKMQTSIMRKTSPMDINLKSKEVKQSLYRPGQALRVPGV
jgi:hypothetical protein